jgi:hypothetical protein
MTQQHSNSTGLCMCGCGNPVPRAAKTRSATGTVKGEFVRYLRGHNKRNYFGPEYEIDPITGCWNWRHYVNEGGYAMRAVNGYPHLAHRLIYVEIVGPIPDGHQLHHRCENKRCVNPDHVEPLTPKAHKHLSRWGTAKLSYPIAAQIRSRAGNESVQTLATEFGVSDQTIYDVLHGKRWNH